MIRRACLLCLLLLLSVPPMARAQEEPASDEPPAAETAGPATGDESLPAPPPGTPPAPPPDPETDGMEDVEVDLGPVSAAASRMLDRVRDSVVQVRGFYGTSRAEAFHGSAFAIDKGGILLTNYHVVARAALYPWDYRLEYYAEDGSTGRITILAVDVLHDLAVIRAEGLDLPVLRLRTAVPQKGDRAYAVGYPLHLGLVITEGIFNGRLDNEYGAKLHYAGPMNAGMSGGPALDSRGRVFGINVSISTRGQLISFLVPAEFVPPLLARAEKPLAPGEARQDVTRQLRGHQAAVLGAIPKRLPTQTSAGYSLPAELAPFVDCTGGAELPPTRKVLLQSVNCRADVALSVQPGLLTGDFQFSHHVMVSRGLHPLQFGEQLRQLANRVRPAIGSAQHVTPYSCRQELVALDRFKAMVTLCARTYRMYDELYDISMLVTSLNHPGQGVVSTLLLRGVDFEAGLGFCGSFLQAMRWTQ